MLALTPSRYRWLQCECTYCHSPLVVCMGDKRRWQFAFTPGSEQCGYGTETGLHLAANQLIEDEAPSTHYYLYPARTGGQASLAVLRCDKSYPPIKSDGNPPGSDTSREGCRYPAERCQRAIVGGGHCFTQGR